MKELEIVKENVEGKNLISLDETNEKVIGDRLKQLELIGKTIKESLKEGIDNDYAIIPGTKKPTLLQPGANKILLMFGIRKEFIPIKMEIDHVIMNCKLYDSNGVMITESYGSAIPKTSKSGYANDVQRDMNTLIKIAQKRAMVGATVQIANLSEVFTQDMDDFAKNEQVNYESLLSQYLKTNKVDRIKFKLVCNELGIKGPKDLNEESYQKLLARENEFKS